MIPTPSRTKIIAVVQSRLTSARFPRKVLEKVNGKSMLARVCEAARNSFLVDKVVVVWAHKFPHLNENDVLGRYRETVERENPDIVVRLTSDCPLLTTEHIDDAITHFLLTDCDYFYNSLDGFDVQVFYPPVLWSHLADTEHVIKPVSVPKGLSVDTPEDLERVRNYAR